MNKGKTQIYQIKVTLRHVAPPVWRRIEVPADIKLGKLHHVLQTVMGWTNSHMHAFRQGMEQYGTPSREFPDMFKNERSVRLDQLAGKGDKLIYEYDFGDRIEPRAAGQGWPCLRFRRRLGARAQDRESAGARTGPALPALHRRQARLPAR